MDFIILYNEQLNMNQPSMNFPSFAASPQDSPNRFSQHKMQTSSQNEIHKISIHLPESMVESTFDENATLSEEKQQESNIRVYCRFRPPVKIPMQIKYDTTMIDDGETRYSFDKIFGKFSSQQELYEKVAKRHIDQFFEGRNSTIFAYGQTGSGKTFTMFGDLRHSQQFGIIPRALTQIFTRQASKQDVFTCSMLEIYNQKLIDLFNPISNSTQDIKLKEYNDYIFLENLIQITVQNQDELLNLIKLGHRGRKIASTYNNDCSSRSHTILFVYRTFKCQEKQYKCKLCFIDLAGSQKVRKSGVKGQTLEETKKINLSLSCLGNVVFALTNSSEHIPYRNSKLTRILKDSLSGDTKTSIVTTCSLEKSDYNQTMSTIKFAVRAKKIKNKKRLNNQEVTMEEIVEQLRRELALTKKELDWYKKRQEGEMECERQSDRVIGGSQIPQELVSSQPIRSIFLRGGVGVSSRVKLIQTISSE